MRPRPQATQLPGPRETVCHRAAQLGPMQADVLLRQRVCQLFHRFERGGVNRMHAASVHHHMAQRVARCNIARRRAACAHLTCAGTVCPHVARRHCARHPRRDMRGISRRESAIDTHQQQIRPGLSGVARDVAVVAAAGDAPQQGNVRRARLPHRPQQGERQPGEQAQFNIDRRCQHRSEHEHRRLGAVVAPQAQRLAPVDQLDHTGDDDRRQRRTRHARDHAGQQRRGREQQDDGDDGGKLGARAGFGVNRRARKAARHRHGGAGRCRQIGRAEREQFTVGIDGLAITRGEQLGYGRALHISDQRDQRSGRCRFARTLPVKREVYAQPGRPRVRHRAGHGHAIARIQMPDHHRPSGKQHRHQRRSAAKQRDGEGGAAGCIAWHIAGHAAGRIAGRTPGRTPGRIARRAALRMAHGKPPRQRLQSKQQRQTAQPQRRRHSHH